MKKMLKRVLCAVLCLLVCLSMCACGSTPEPAPTPTPDPTPKTISQTDAEAIARQAIVNICCVKSNVESLKFNTYKIEGTTRKEDMQRAVYTKYSDEERRQLEEIYKRLGKDLPVGRGVSEYAGGWEVVVVGTYYPIDKYDEYGTKVYFEITMSVYDDRGYSYNEFEWKTANKDWWDSCEDDLTYRGFFEPYEEFSSYNVYY